MLAIHVKDLNPVATAIGNVQRWSFSFAPINPQAMRKIELATLVAGSAETANPFGVFVELVNEITSVAIGQEEPAVVQERKVRRKETFSIPSGLCRKFFFLFVDSGLNRGSLVPNNVALERCLRERLRIRD